MVCVVLMIKTRGSLSCQAPEMQLIRVAEHLGASSRRPRHPFPALMAGVNPGRVPVNTALKIRPLDVQHGHVDNLVRKSAPTAETPQFSALSGPLSRTQRARQRGPRTAPVRTPRFRHCLDHVRHL